MLHTELKAIAVVAMLVVSQSANAQESFQGLGFLPGPAGFKTSVAYDVSSDGSVVVGVSSLDACGCDVEAFRWTSAGMVGLGFLPSLPGSEGSIAFGVSGDGSVVVGQSTSSASPLDSEAFRWTSAGMVGLGFLPSPEGSEYSTAYFGVSDDGSVVVGHSSSSASPLWNQEAFRWTSAGMVGLGFLPSTPGFERSTAYDVSGDGSVVVGMSSSSASPVENSEAFRWTSAGMVGLGFLPSTPGSEYSIAYRVSGDGSVVVGQSSSSASPSNEEAFRWTSGGMVGLGFLGGSSSVAIAVNSDGSVIVGTAENASLLAEAFRWTQADGMQSIRALLVTAGVDMTGWELALATGVSASGNTIVGAGVSPSSPMEAWIARFGPEGVVGLTTPGSLQQSVDGLAEDRFGAMAQQHGLAMPLLGDDKPIEEWSEAGIFGMGGSAAGGGHVRYATGTGLALLAGISYGTEAYDGIELDDSLMGAAGLRYLLPTGSWWRPFGEVGGWLAPDAGLTFDRTYTNGAGTVIGSGETEGDFSYYFARAGMLFAVAPGQQVVASAEIGHESFETDGYAEPLSNANPFPALMATATDEMDVAKARLQWSFLLGHGFDVTLWGAGAWGFNRDSELAVDVTGIGIFLPMVDEEAVWAEYNARVGYAVTETATIDVFVSGLSGNDGIDSRLHAGAGLRFRF